MGFLERPAIIDLWIECSPENAGRVWRALGKFGAPLADLSKADLIEPGAVIQIGVIPRRIDILTEITGVTFDEARSGRVMVNLENLTIPVIGRTHLIQNKKAVGRPQDRADAARLEAND